MQIKRRYVVEVTLAWDAFTDGLAWLCEPTDRRSIFTPADEVANAANSFHIAEQLLSTLDESVCFYCRGPWNEHEGCPKCDPRGLALLEAIGSDK